MMDWRTIPVISPQTIIDRIGGPAAIGHALGVPPNNTKRWRWQNSIPAKYWWQLSQLRLATLDELALAHAAPPYETRQKKHA